MNVGLYSGVAAMRSAERRLDSVTSNLANAGTTGYRRREAATHAVRTPRGGRDAVALSTEVRIDRSQGQLERTGSPSHLALMGEGFFAVEAPEGEVYTRAGEFQFSASGTLETIEGWPVSWVGGRGVIDPVGEPVTVDAGGTVFQGTQQIGRLRIVDFDEPDELQVLSHEYYRAPLGAPTRPAEGEVHQFALERSNVQSVDEMIALITVQRSYESAARLLQTLDQSYQRLNQPR